MTRKHFEILADWFAEYHISENSQGVTTCLEDMLDTLAQELAQTNPNFDQSRFIQRASRNA